MEGTVFYNDNDAYCCAWLRNLIAAGHLPTGTILEQDIRTITSAMCQHYQQCHWFAGLGGWPYALD
jgi:DNA (cytosine-5)-methyltransferase 1